MPSGKTAFFASPFNEQFVWIRDAVRAACEKKGSNFVAVDESALPGSDIPKQIISAIEECDLAFVVLTDTNPNVFYELGYLHALEKPTVLLTDTFDKRLPFDLAHRNVISYGSFDKKTDTLTDRLLEAFAKVEDFYFEEARHKAFKDFGDLKENVYAALRAKQRIREPDRFGRLCEAFDVDLKHWKDAALEWKTGRYTAQRFYEIRLLDEYRNASRSIKSTTLPEYITQLDNLGPRLLENQLWSSATEITRIFVFRSEEEVQEKWDGPLKNYLNYANDKLQALPSDRSLQLISKIVFINDSVGLMEQVKDFAIIDDKIVAETTDFRQNHFCARWIYADDISRYTGMFDRLLAVSQNLADYITS
jgi:nucleoside 2-deoxyribosyltransferase